MNSNAKRAAVIQQYETILGRNLYSQPKRDYCFRKYKDGKYYSDCSSSISYSYRMAGFDFGILNTVGMYQSDELVDVPVIIKNGQITNPEVLRVGDLLLYAGSDPSRQYAGYVGHVEIVYSINGLNVKICGHGSGKPSVKDLKSYCRTRFNSKTGRTRLGHKGLIRVRRYIKDDNLDSGNIPMRKVIVTGGSVFVRRGPGQNFSMHSIARRGDTFDRMNVDGWRAIWHNETLCWVSSQYIGDGGVCLGNGVNIRLGAGINFKSIGKLYKGDVVHHVNYDGWVPIVVNDESLWISDLYVE